LGAFAFSITFDLATTAFCKSAGFSRKFRSISSFGSTCVRNRGEAQPRQALEGTLSACVCSNVIIWPSQPRLTTISSPSSSHPSFDSKLNRIGYP
jgi:hypothetical protein